MTVTVRHIVRADNGLEATTLAYLRLPAQHRDAARFVECEPDPWLPPGVPAFRPSLGWQPQGFCVTFELPSMSVADAIVPDYPPAA